jgi:hypothetical protein
MGEYLQSDLKSLLRKLPEFDVASLTDSNIICRRIMIHPFPLLSDIPLRCNPNLPWRFLICYPVETACSTMDQCLIPLVDKI